MKKESNPKKFDKKKNLTNNLNNKEDNNDDRFKSVFSDPKFANIPKYVEKVQLQDNRFNSMFTDKKFNNVTSVDERGFKPKKGIWMYMILCHYDNL